LIAAGRLRRENPQTSPPPIPEASGFSLIAINLQFEADMRRRKTLARVKASRPASPQPATGLQFEPLEARRVLSGVAELLLDINESVRRRAAMSK
jgi:hypothetical protein